MKIPCRVDSLHFKNEFEDTLKSPCNLWGDLGLSNISIESKKKFWDWFFSAPMDEIAIEDKIGMSIEFSSAPILPETEFKNIYPGYENLEDQDKQELQKEFHKRKKLGVSTEGLLVDIIARKEKN